MSRSHVLRAMACVVCLLASGGAFAHGRHHHHHLRLGLGQARGDRWYDVGWWGDPNACGYGYYYDYGYDYPYFYRNHRHSYYPYDCGYPG